VEGVGDDPLRRWVEDVEADARPVGDTRCRNRRRSEPTSLARKGADPSVRVVVSIPNVVYRTE
jgi:hypothetical protein